MKKFNFTLSFINTINKYLLVKILYAVVLVIVFSSFALLSKDNNAGNKSADNTLNIKVANAYGVENFSKVNKISYTFSVNFGGKIFNRKWEWHPKTKDVTYWGKDSTGKDETFSYNENKSMDEKTKKIDAMFINDNYWLLFPFHLAWDTNVEFKDDGMKNYPLGKGKGECLIVTYSNKVGYTPGDVFKLYLDKDNLIHEWTYLNGGSTKKPFSTTWEGNKSFNGITISTEHMGSDKKFKLSLIDINVEYEK